MKGTYFPPDHDLNRLFEEATLGCSTRGVMLSAALLLIYAIDDELDSDLTPKAKKNVNAELRKELFEKILGASGNRSHLIPFTAPEFREFRKCREDAKGDEVREGSDTAALHTDNIVPFKR